MKDYRLALACVYLSLCLSVRAGIKEIYRQSKDSLAVVIGLDDAGQPLTTGSGFFVSDGTILATSYHIIQSANAVEIRTSSGDTQKVTQVQAVDESRDIALLKLKRKGQAIQLSQGTPDVGEKVLALGNPRGLEASLSDGIVSGVRSNADLTLYQITAPISPGSSGGPIMNERGEVIGIATLYLIESQNLNFAVPSRYIQELLGKSAPRALNPWHCYGSQNSKVISNRPEQLSVLSHGWTIIRRVSENGESTQEWRWEVKIEAGGAKRTPRVFYGIKRIEYRLYDKNGLELEKSLFPVRDLIHEIGTTDTYKATGTIRIDKAGRAHSGSCTVELE